MARPIPPPAYRELLPPLLACLPTAFASSKPPPTLLPLLSPILRQRVQLLSESTSSPSNSWLTKLSWDSAKAEKLASVVEGDAFELHPVSNEIEFDEVEKIGYKRLDEETLHARVAIRDLSLKVVYVWCLGDQEGGGDGWRVAEVVPLESIEEEDKRAWCSTVTEADSRNRDKVISPSSTGQVELGFNGTQNAGSGVQNDADDSDEDDYWTQYDNAPSSTPGPNPPPDSAKPSKETGHARTASEAEYFARYAQVQPEMDNDDPSNHSNVVGESTFVGNSLVPQSTEPSARLQNLVDTKDAEIQAPQPHSPLRKSFLPNEAESGATTDLRFNSSSPAGSGSATVDRLEDSAMLQSQTELAIRQHVSTSIKSLWRLARSAGIELPEFDRMVRTEVEVLGMLEEGEAG
ncbi:MAG: hypothetical protein LQ351_004361 [Letrouitia transgressa]|nr:MAG: hypothetical protein LQ351_004361 [Letrouitia transgressa]